MIIVPPNILPTKEVDTLPPKEREAYIGSIIMDIIKENRRGVTISDVVKATQFNRITATKHLENLVAIREAYKKSIGKTSVYFKNGKVVHETELKSQQLGNKTYSFYLLENEIEAESTIYIQEKETDDFYRTKVNGGILINSNDALSFLKELEDFVLRREKNEV